MTAADFCHKACPGLMKSEGFFFKVDSSEALCPGPEVSGQTGDNVEEDEEIIRELTNLSTLQPRETAHRIRRSWSCFLCQINDSSGLSQ